MLRELSRLEGEYRVTIPYLVKIVELDKELKQYEEEKLESYSQSGETEMKAAACVVSSVPCGASIKPYRKRKLIYYN